MGVYKDKSRGDWFVSYRYVDSFGNHKRKYKRGFRTRAEAQRWERDDRLKEEFSTDMTLERFYELYEADLKNRVTTIDYIVTGRKCIVVEDTEE